MTVSELSLLLRQHPARSIVELRIVGLTAIGASADEIITHPASVTVSKDNRNRVFVQITNAEEAR